MSEATRGAATAARPGALPPPRKGNGPRRLDQHGLDEIERQIDALLGRMSLEEKVEQTHGAPGTGLQEVWETAANARLGIPAFRMADGPRGVRVGRASAFPVAMARGATWDPELEQRIGTAIGLEARARGVNVLLAPTINLLRHPRWGRAQETYGEDSFHIGILGAAFITGAQEHVCASVKHFAVNSIENTRFAVNIELDERTLREVYLPHFRRAIDAGVGTVMSAYNRVRGTYCAEHDHLLRDILKGEWGFAGVVESDWIFGVRSTTPSARAGLDVEMPFPNYYGEALLTALRSGDLAESVLDEMVRRILRVKFRFGMFDDPAPGDPAVVECTEHRALAREAARRAMVLLRNAPIGAETALPLDVASLQRIAIVGLLAGRVNLGDTGSSDARPTLAVSPLDGCTAAWGTDRVLALPTDTPSDAELSAIAAADAAIVVVGLTSREEGEGQISGGDRHGLRLPTAHEDLILAVAARQPRTIVVLEGGSAIDVEVFVDEIAALLMAWYPGMEGGNALAEVLDGRVNPSGKLPISLPRNEADLPPFDASSHEVHYAYLHGYRHLDATDALPRFAFGFGLSYTRFQLSALEVTHGRVRDGDTIRLALTVTNLGPRDGTEVVQAYVSRPDSTLSRAPRELRAFRRVEVPAGGRVRAELEIAVTDLRHWDEATSAWRLEPGLAEIVVGTSSRDLPLATAVFLDDCPD